MENDNLQKELFEFEQPKKTQLHKFGQLFQRPDFCLVLTAEKLVFVSIGIIMLMVVFFAIGVEKGKSRAPKAASPLLAEQAAAPQVPVKAAAIPIKQVKAGTISTNVSPKTMPVKVVPEAQKVPAQAAQPAGDKPYTIVAAAFLRQDFAAKEANLLKGNGLDAFVLKSEPYYLACVGSFVNKDSAKNVLSKVRQLHRDAYLRLR